MWAKLKEGTSFASATGRNRSPRRGQPAAAPAVSIVFMKARRSIRSYFDTPLTACQGPRADSSGNRSKPVEIAGSLCYVTDHERAATTVAVGGRGVEGGARPRLARVPSP